MKWRSLTICALATFTQLIGAAPLFSYPPQRLDLRGIRRIEVSGVSGHLYLHGRATGRSLSLRVKHTASPRDSDWNLEVERRGSVLVLQVDNVAMGRQWRRELSKNQWPEFDLVLDGPALPVSVGWREGRVDVVDWNAEVKASSVAGEVHILGGRGPIDLQVVQADVEVRAREGDSHLRGGGGRLQLVACVGATEVKMTDADLLVQGGSGRLDVDVEAGRVQVLNYAGQVDGHGASAHWQLSLGAPSLVQVESQAGAVDMDWRSGGTQAFLTSALGRIVAPAGAAWTSRKDHGRRVIEGFARQKSMGHVFIRTESGPIRLGLNGG